MSRELDDIYGEMPRGLLMGALGLDGHDYSIGGDTDPMPAFMYLDPFDPRQADAWAAAVAEWKAAA